MAEESCVVEDEPWIAGPEDLPDEPPRRFVLVEYDDEGEPHVFLWGLQLPGLAVCVGPDGDPLSKNNSAESAHRMFSIAYDDLELLWIDPPVGQPQ
jgi:hypothetical protein